VRRAAEKNGHTLFSPFFYLLDAGGVWCEGFSPSRVKTNKFMLFVSKNTTAMQE